MVPLPRFQQACDRAFTVGEVYPLVVQEERSQASHRQYFAALNDAWMNLTDEDAMRFPTAEHLRKWALVQAGYADERSIACTDKLEARKVAAFIRPIDEYAVVVVREATIKVFTPKSQSVRAMGKRDFQESKEAVLGVVASMIGVKPAELTKNAGAAA